MQYTYSSIQLSWIQIWKSAKIYKLKFENLREDREERKTTWTKLIFTHKALWMDELKSKSIIINGVHNIKIWKSEVLASIEKETEQGELVLLHH